MKAHTILATAIFGLFTAMSSAGATVLNPGQPPIPFASLASAPGGTLLDSLITPISTLTFSGIARTAVYDGPETGTNLDFYYQFSNNSGSQNAIARMTAASFEGFLTDVYQTATGFDLFQPGTNPADTADRSSNGRVVGFNFIPGTQNALDPGETSYIMVVRTDATQYTQGSMGIIDGSGATALAFAPIPEPETYALMLAGLGLLGFARRRQLKQARAKSRAGMDAMSMTAA